LGYACSFVRSVFNIYILSRELQYQSADSTQTDGADSNAVLVFRVAMKGGRKSVKVTKTLIILRQLVMNVELMEFPFPSSGSVTSFIF
jgi:hypothetical protein